MNKKAKAALEKAEKALAAAKEASKVNEAAPSEKTYKEAINDAAQAVIDDPTLLAAEIDLKWSEISKLYKVRVSVVRADGEAVYKALKTARDADAEAKPDLAGEAGRLAQKWQTDGAASYDAGKYPETLSDFDWPIRGYDDDLPHALEMLDKQWCVVNIEGKTRYANTANIRNGQGIQISSKTDFTDRYENRVVMPPKDSDAKPTSLAKIWLRRAARREYNSVDFCPMCADVSTDTLNLFVGFGVEPKEGDWSLLRTHIRENVCRGDDLHFRWFMAWMAQLIQVPSEKTGVMVVLKGKKGTGKSKVGQWLRKIIGSAHSHSVSQRKHVTGNFNAHMAACILLCVEEGFWAGDKEAESVIKDLITGDTVMLEKKSIDAFSMRNFTRLLQTTNADWAVPTDADERRFFVLEVGDARMQDSAYFKAIDEQMANGGAEAMMHELQNYAWEDQEDIDLFNPPKTEALKQQVAKGLDPVAAWWRDALMEGGFYVDGEFFEIPAYGGAVPKSSVQKSLAPILGKSWAANKLTTHITETLKPLVPGLNAAAKTTERDLNGHRSGNRVPAYEFPSMADMRTAWQQKFKEAPWGQEAADTSAAMFAMLRRARNENKQRRETV